MYIILSGEGEQGTYRPYKGKESVRALKSALTKERAHGDRWARLYQHDYDNVYIELRATDTGFEPCGRREIMPQHLDK